MLDGGKEPSTRLFREIIMKKFCSWKLFLALYILFDIFIGGHNGGFIPLSETMAAQQLQTQYVQNLGPVNNGTGCTAATGVATSAAIAPCGGQGSMFQNSQVTSMTLSWTAVATVSSCTIQLEQASTLNGTYTLLGTAQTCTSSGSYTASLSAAFVRVNITALTTSGNGSLVFNYFGQIGNTPANVLSSAINCGTSTACSPVFTTAFRLVYGSCTAAAATTCTVTGIAPPFTGTTSYFCAASDATTAANGALKITYSSSSSFVITTASSSDTFNWLCWGT